MSDPFRRDEADDQPDPSVAAATPVLDTLSTEELAAEQKAARRQAAKEIVTKPLQLPKAFLEGITKFFRIALDAVMHAVQDYIRWWLVTVPASGLLVAIATGFLTWPQAVAAMAALAVIAGGVSNGIVFQWRNANEHLAASITAKGKTGRLITPGRWQRLALWHLRQLDSYRNHEYRNTQNKTPLQVFTPKVSALTFFGAALFAGAGIAALHGSLTVALNTSGLISGAGWVVFGGTSLAGTVAWLGEYWDELEGRLIAKEVAQAARERDASTGDAAS